jgi:hypothetical protein
MEHVKKNAKLKVAKRMSEQREQRYPSNQVPQGDERPDEKSPQSYRPD